MKKSSPVFEGTVDPAVVEEWISMIENIFEFVQIKNEDKMKCIVYMLRKKTRDVALMT